MMTFIFWIVSMVVVLSAWEANAMGMDWWGVTPASEWTYWGFQERTYVRWSFRMGPIEIFRMK